MERVINCKKEGTVLNHTWGRVIVGDGCIRGYVKRIRGKSPAKWGVQMAGMNFQAAPGCPGGILSGLGLEGDDEDNESNP